MQPTEIIKFIKDLYQKNNFMQYCGIQVISICCGEASVGIEVNSTHHTNLNGRLHGGLLMTLIDNSTGIAAASVGKRAVSTTTSINFIKGAKPGDFVIATANVLDIDGSIINLKITVRDKATNTILATCIATMVSIADFPGIPEKW